MDLVRLAIRARTYAHSHMDYLIEAVARSAYRACDLPGMPILSQPRQPRHFTARVPASDPSTSGGLRGHLLPGSGRAADAAAGPHGSDTDPPRRPFPSTTAILTGSTATDQPVRHGPDQPKPGRQRRK
jgi:hypothetical protein